MLDYFQELLGKAERRRDLEIQEHPLKYSKGTFPFYRFSSTNILPEDNLVLIAAGIHGDERCGPHTLNEHFDEIWDHAQEQGVKLIMYPVRNPSGYSVNQRFNIDEDRGDHGIGNNDSLRYLLLNGNLRDELKREKKFLKWYWADDPRLELRLTAEDTLLLKLAHKELWTQIKGVLDLHQDHLTEYLRLGAYHYSPNPNTDAYLPILTKISGIVPILTNTPIDGGFREEEDPERNDLFYTDNRGFISRHDGSFDDLVYRLGVPHVVTVETSGEIPLPKADQVNLEWIKGMIDLIAKK